MHKKRILILQNVVFHYRKPVFNMLAEQYDVTVLHSGKRSVGAGDRYREIITKVRKLGPFYIQAGVLAAVRDPAYDVVVAMFDLRWLANIAARGLASGKRFLYWGHRYSKSALVNIAREFLMRSCDGVILYGASEIGRMVAHGVPRERIFVAHNTIDVPNHSDASGAPKNSLLYVGRAQRRKRVDLLVRAFAELRDRIPGHVRLDIVGEGEENENLKALTRELGLEGRVDFPGEISDDTRLRPHFERAYAYVSPGPVGLGVLHSFAYGVPVVTEHAQKHGPEFSNVANGENARVFRTYDEFKEILLQLVTDPGLSSRLGHKAYELYARERTIGKMVAGFIEAIENRRAQP